jgi:tetratricopeptide (TPR) repeat protein
MRSLAAVTLIAVATMVPPGTTGAQPSDHRSRCFAREGVSPEQALASCTAVIESGQQAGHGLAVALNNRGNAHLGNRNYDRAIDDYSKAIRLDRRYALGFSNRGLAYVRKGRIDRAIEDFDEAIRLNPKFAMAFVHRAVAYLEKAQWDFDAYLAEGKYEDLAIQDLDKAIRLDRNNAVAYRNRGFVNARMQRYDRAIQDYDEAIRLDPRVSSHFSGRAYALRFVGQYERAIADYRKALTLQLDDANRRQIERALKQLGVATEREAASTPVTKR